MKTAISLPNDLFAIAETFAKERGVSRSELYATALREYIDTHRNDTLTARINQACTLLDSDLPADLATVVRNKLTETEW